MEKTQEFLALESGISLRVSAEGTLCEVHRGGHLLVPGNSDMAALLTACDGTRTIEEIVRAKTTSDEFYEASLPGVRRLVEHLKSIGVVRPNASRALVPVSLVERWAYAPLSVTVELTSRCSLRCRYCYQDSGPERADVLTDPIGLLRALRKLDVHTVELTGGEPTLHPQFREALDFALAEFPVVGLITNGLHLAPDIVSALAQGRARVIVQVSLDGPDEEYVDAVVGVPGAFRRIVDGIRRIKAAGIRLRVGMVFDSAEGVDRLERTLELALSLGADGFLAVPALAYGRARGRSDFFDSETAGRFVVVHNRLREKYPGFYSREAEGFDPEHLAPCGAGERAMTVTWTGACKICPMQPAGWFDLDTAYEILSEPSQGRMRTAASLRPPSRERCQGCSRTFDCLNCFLRPLNLLATGQMTEGDCRWYRSERTALRAAGLSSVFP